MTDKEITQICNALQDWFKSQGMKPSEGVGICEIFIAKMMLANAQFGDLEAKLTGSNDRIRNYIALRLMSTK